MNVVIQSVIDEVLELDDVKPSLLVNETMFKLVACALNSPRTALETIDEITQTRIQDTSSRAETALEIFWSEKISQSSDPHATLTTFPYISNYNDLTQRELRLVEQSGLCLSRFHRVLIVGSGPLPLSAIEIYRQTGAAVDHVDVSSDAIALSKQISRVLSIDSTHYHAAGASVVLHKQYDLVLIAALAGRTLADKQAIIDNVLTTLSAQGRIVIRTAQGMRTLLYPPIEARKLLRVNLLCEYHPDDHVINSLLIYERQ